MTDPKTPATSGPRTALEIAQFHADEHRDITALQSWQQCTSWPCRAVTEVLTTADVETLAWEQASVIEQEAADAKATDWKKRYEGMVKERDDQIRRKRETRRILTERSDSRALREPIAAVSFLDPVNESVRIVRDLARAALASPAKTPPEPIGKTESLLHWARRQPEPWHHPYDGDPEYPDRCIHCGQVGSYAHTREFYEKSPPEPEGLERAYFDGYMAGAGDFTATPPPKSEVETYARNYARLTANQPSDHD